MWRKFSNSSISLREIVQRAALGSSSIIWTDTSYGLEILQECGKGVKTKNQKNLGASSYVCNSYRGENGKGVGIFAAPF